MGRSWVCCDFPFTVTAWFACVTTWNNDIVQFSSPSPVSGATLKVHSPDHCCTCDSAKWWQILTFFNCVPTPQAEAPGFNNPLKTHSENTKQSLWRWNLIISLANVFSFSETSCSQQLTAAEVSEQILHVKTKGNVFKWPSDACCNRSSAPTQLMELGQSSTHFHVSVQRKHSCNLLLHPI